MKSKSKKNIKAKLLELYTERDKTTMIKNNKEVSTFGTDILSAKIEMLTWVLSNDDNKLEL
jgi:hypothetical protein